MTTCLTFFSSELFYESWKLKAGPCRIIKKQKERDQDIIKLKVKNYYEHDYLIFLSSLNFISMGLSPNEGYFFVCLFL